jgi:hypothetical protein
MERSILILFSLFLSYIGFSQSISGVVTDVESGERLAFVNIYSAEWRIGTYTDIDGKFQLTVPSEVGMITFSLIGYQPYEVQIDPASDKRFYKIQLQPTSLELSEVELVADENPAIPIIRKVVENRKANRPENYESYRHTTYNKFVVTMDAVSEDTVFTEAGEVDTNWAEVKEFSDEQHVFLMESVSKKSYINGKRDNENVIASRVSGLSDPQFVLLANQLQSFTFYSDYIQVLSSEFLNPISPNSEKRYVFILQDTTYHDGDTIYRISYQPSVNANINGLKGVININTNGWAIQNVTAEPADTNELPVRIQQQYKRFSGKWFPFQLNTDLNFQSVSVNGFSPIGIGRTYIDSVEIGIEMNHKEVEVAQITVDKYAHKRPDEYWNNFRRDTLDQREKRTYEFIDSIGEEFNLDRKLNFARAFLSGYLRTGVVDWDIYNFIRYNSYEKLRLNIGIQTNPRLFDRWTFGGNIAYGFGDKTFKYGGFTEYLLHKKYNWKWRLSYRHDLNETGEIHYLGEDRNFLYADIRELAIFKMDFNTSFGIQTSALVRPSLKINAGIQNRTIRHLANYSYDTPLFNQDVTYNEVVGEIEWSPGAVIMQTQYGIVNVERSDFTAIVQHRMGMPTENSFENYHRTLARLRYKKRIRNAGTSYFQVEAGNLSGQTTVSNFFNLQGNSPNDIADYYAFNSLGVHALQWRQFSSIQYHHRFPKLFEYSRLNMAPVPVIHLKSLYGSSESAGITLDGQPLLVRSSPYWEAGISLEGIISNLGVGVFYGNWFDAAQIGGRQMAIQLTFSSPF